MTGTRSRLKRGVLAGFLVWTIVCSALASMSVPHTVFICEHIESIFRGSPDDEIIEREKIQLAGVLWMTGFVVAPLSMAAVRGIRRARRVQSVR